MSALPPIPWPRPPVGGYFAEHLERMVDLPRHTELIDGSLVFVSPQTVFHTLTLDVLVAGLRRCAPPDLRVRREMSVILAPRQRFTPDIVVVHADAVLVPDVVAYPVDAVVLAVEVESPDSVLRDRGRKQELYAKAGIRHLWRVEDGGEEGPVVHATMLDTVIHTYGLLNGPRGIFRDRVKLSIPFDIDIDLTEISRL